MPRTTFALLLLCVIAFAAFTIWLATAFGATFGAVSVFVIISVALCARFIIARNQ
ncbi:hypothetical protein [Yoonia maritima]|uniref:hypothetical protein n=1 Tax=Yoonia maritima TaxID=1435347 RepID=UPI0013A64DF1|nr:hypothetical protein [Yoonia maritima]